MNKNDILRFIADPEEGFKVQEKELFGKRVFLITPDHIGVTWTNNNCIFRSSLWNEAGELVSGSFRKFCNVGEQSGFEPLNLDEKLTFVEKRDGSCLILSKVDGLLCARTRGTVDARQLDNGFEIDELIKLYPDAFDNFVLNSGQYSLLFEWESRINQIVLRHKELKLVLVGAVRHDDYSYLTQNDLDILAYAIGVERPKTFSFESFDAALTEIKEWENAEGVVIYSKDGQTLKKVKSEWYRQQHYFRTNNGGSPNKIGDLWESVGCPKNYEEFFAAVEKFHDFEIAEFLDDSLKDAGEFVANVFKKDSLAREGLKKQPDDRKTKALWIQEHKDEIFQKVAFLNLSGKVLDKSIIKSMIVKYLKENERQ